MRFTSLPRAARAYILGVVGLAAGLVVASGIWSGLGQGAVPALAAPLVGDWWTFATLVLAAGVAHVFPVSSVEHRQAYHVSLPFFIAAAILLPPLAFVSLMVVVHLAEWVRR